MREHQVSVPILTSLHLFPAAPRKAIVPSGHQSLQCHLLTPFASRPGWGPDGNDTCTTLSAGSVVQIDVFCSSSFTCHGVVTVEVIQASLSYLSYLHQVIISKSPVLTMPSLRKMSRYAASRWNPPAQRRRPHL